MCKIGFSCVCLVNDFIWIYFDFGFQIEQKPHNKDELMVSNSVLKLAADLLKVRISHFSKFLI